MNMTDTLDLPPMPPRIASLPRNARGYPVPFFVAWINGVPDFRMVKPEKIREVMTRRICWICGTPLGLQGTFAIGPMCSVNRVNSEPPSHRQCAEFAVCACPFMLRPNMVRREDEMTRAHEGNVAGVMIKRNPGVIALWTTRTWSPFNDGKGGMLLRLGEPTHVSWWREGRAAMCEEVKESISTGIPLLKEMCDSDADHAALELSVRRAITLVERTTRKSDGIS